MLLPGDGLAQHAAQRRGNAVRRLVDLKPGFLGGRVGRTPVQPALPAAPGIRRADVDRTAGAHEPGGKGAEPAQRPIVIILRRNVPGARQKAEIVPLAAQIMQVHPAVGGTDKLHFGAVPDRKHPHSVPFSADEAVFLRPEQLFAVPEITPCIGILHRVPSFVCF